MCQYDFTSVYMFVAMPTGVLGQKVKDLCKRYSWLHNWKPDAVIDSWYVVDVAIIVRWLWYCFGTFRATFYTEAHSSQAPAHYGRFFTEGRFCHNIYLCLYLYRLYRPIYRPRGGYFRWTRKLWHRLWWALSLRCPAMLWQINIVVT